ncbi:hypothetical protein CQA53_09335 [Helicobacter didelphidarum]|uniref:Uncharacterized protein n=1 Tax=Helicobacter didelphidarum TaxID=2040648 RepID=A0A3D8IB61_9HELI|nr:hypothetical protein CQA53_09335 [Helicobacter didelphidarum]
MVSLKLLNSREIFIISVLHIAIFVNILLYFITDNHLMIYILILLCIVMGSYIFYLFSRLIKINMKNEIIGFVIFGLLMFISLLSYGIYYIAF